MAYLEKVLKVTEISEDAGMSYKNVPLFGYYRDGSNIHVANQPVFMSGQEIYTGFLITTKLFELTGTSSFEELCALIKAMNGARIFNRTSEQCPLNTYIEIAVYDNEGNEIPFYGQTTYRPAFKHTQNQGNGETAPLTGIYFAATANDAGATLFQANYYMYNFMNSHSYSDAENYLFAVAYQNESSSGDQIDAYLFFTISAYHDGVNNQTVYRCSYIDFNANAWAAAHDNYVNPVKPLPVADDDFSDTTSTEEGYKGKGAHDHTSDKISAAADPVVSTAQVGFFHIYHVNSGSLSALSQYLFPDILGSLIDADFEGILRAFASLFAYRDNIQYIVDLHAIPVAPTDGAAAYVKVGALETDISVPAVVSDYVNCDCGSLSIPENFASFLDYTHTRAKLFLPGVGFVDIKNEFWQSGVLNVKYKFNVVDGSFMCFVSATSSKSQLEETVIGQYGGTMCIHFPVMSQSYGAMMSGIVAGAAMISTGGAAEAAAMQQGKTAAAAAAQQTKAQGYFSALQAAPLQKTVQSSNSYNSSTSFLGNRTPYLMIERAVPNYAGYYNLESGVPLNVSMPLSMVHGYTEIENIVFAGQTFATDEEIADIKEKLRNGAIF